MGYTTEFSGSVTVEPPLNEAEIAYLRKFAETRRMARSFGPYYVDGPGDFGQERTPDVYDYNTAPQGQPGLWCHWVPTDSGSAIEWDGGEKFYYAEEWMAYIVDHFLRPDAEASRSGESQFAGFTFDHVVNGSIEAAGEQADDRWRLDVHDNVVSRAEGRIVYGGES
jgi:hypothetical protein